MSGRDWFVVCCIAAGVLWCVEWWYSRLEAVLTAKLKLDEAKVESLDRIVGRLEAIQQELAESNAMMAADAECDGDEWTTIDDDDDEDWAKN